MDEKYHFMGKNVHLRSKVGKGGIVL